MSFSLGSVPLSEFESVLKQLTWWTGGIQYVACDKFEKLVAILFGKRSPRYEIKLEIWKKLKCFHRKASSVEFHASYEREKELTV